MPRPQHSTWRSKLTICKTEEDNTRNEEGASERSTEFKTHRSAIDYDERLINTASGPMTAAPQATTTDNNSINS
jgi:hypothetical protein